MEDRDVYNSDFIYYLLASIFQKDRPVAQLVE